MLMPTHLTPNEIAKVARLSRLKLTPAEQQQATTQLDGILGHFAAIQKIATTDVPPADDVTGLHNIARADEAKPDTLTTAAMLLEQAPATKNNQIKVQAVF